VLFLCVVSVVAACVELPSYLEKPIAEMSTVEYVSSVRSRGGSCEREGEIGVRK